MAKVSISEASRLAGKSRSHLYEKYINTGAITVETSRDGKKVIDTSELIRVFGSISLGDSNEDSIKNSSGHQEKGEEYNRIKALLAENEVLREYLRAKDEEVAWLREQVSKTTALLTHQPAESRTAKKWWWPW
jgi:2',3'-cyclic-nucleotide 2'-phosphodiesterase (5'-nucleotidase family)